MAGLEHEFPFPVRGTNLYVLDRNLKNFWRYAPMDIAPWAAPLERFGQFAGGVADEEAEYTDRFAPPVLEPYDRDGTLVNHIRISPLAERVGREVYELGAVGLNYASDPAPFLVTFAMGYLLSQSNLSLHCPLTMTGAVAYVLDRFAPPPLRARHLSAVTRMDGQALSGGTWATERHGGSDVGATTTRAVLNGDEARLYGLKWFASNPAGGLALATARPDGAGAGTAGLGLYLVPFSLADGSNNAIRIRRLKDKLGTRGVPTGELDLDGALAYRLADPPHGFKLMMHALTFSRIHNALSAAGVMRRALLEATGYALRREAFGRGLTAYPMLRADLLKIQVAYEAGFALAFEAALAFERVAALSKDAQNENDPARVWLRLITALAKYATAEGAIACARAALEVIGGNGYTQDYVTARLVRDAQVLTVWEGPANIQALELLRLLWGSPGGANLFVARIEDIARRADPGLAEETAALRAALGDCQHALGVLEGDEAARPLKARRLMAWMADILAGGLLLDRANHDRASFNGRGQLVLQLFIAEQLNGQRKSGFFRDEVTPAQFEALVSYSAL